MRTSNKNSRAQEDSIRPLIEEMEMGWGRFHKELGLVLDIKNVWLVLGQS